MPTYKKTAVTLFGLIAAYSSTSLAALATSGQLVIINGLASANDKGPGVTSSAVTVVVKDAAGTPVTCSTTTSLAYGGSVVVNWNGSLSASTPTACKSIGSVKITPVANAGTGKVVWDSSAITPASSATGVTLVPPTNNFQTIGIMVTGKSGVTQLATSASPAAAAWTSDLQLDSLLPTLDSVGNVTTTGIPGFISLQGFSAAQEVRKLGIDTEDQSHEE